jgi:hypothetical protein
MLSVLFKSESWDSSDLDDDDFQQYIGQDGVDVLFALQTQSKYKRFEIIGPDVETNAISDCKLYDSKDGTSIKIHVSRTGKVREIKIR